jgi:hypothetical protein
MVRIGEDIHFELGKELGHRQHRAAGIHEYRVPGPDQGAGGTGDHRLFLPVQGLPLRQRQPAEVAFQPLRATAHPPQLPGVLKLDQVGADGLRAHPRLFSQLRHRNSSFPHQQFQDVLVSFRRQHGIIIRSNSRKFQAYYRNKSE